MSVRHLRTHDAFPLIDDDGKPVLLSMRFCPYAQRVRLVLDAKRIPHHTININLHHKPLWLNKYSSTGKVPALRLLGPAKSKDSGCYLIESLTIADRLDDEFEAVQLRSKDSVRCAQDAMWVKRFDEVITHFQTILFNRPDDDAAARLFSALDAFEEELCNRGCAFFGRSNDNPKMLDYMIWPWIERLDAMKPMVGEQYELRRERFPLLIEWRTRMLADHAVQASCLSTDNHVKYYKLRREKHDSLYDFLD